MSDTGTPDVRYDVRQDIAVGDVTTVDAREAGADARETGPDVATADARDGGPDARADSADADTGVFADADAADADVAVYPPGLLAYPQQYATAICTGFANCCGATFDVTACEGAFQTQGYGATLPQNPRTIDAGNLTFNASQAAACVLALQNWPCAATWTSVENQAILTACHGVLGGTIPVSGTGCISSFECAGNAYCDIATGVCHALVADGGACTPGLTPEDSDPDFQCSNIATASPALYCTVYPADGGPSDGTGTCQPAQPDGVTSVCSDQGQTFLSDYACANRLCTDNFTCGATTTNPTTSTVRFGYCSSYIIDAGGGG